MDLPDKLKIARQSLGKNQKEMATLLGLAHRSWQGYEQGTSVPGGNVFKALADLGFNINWFFDDNAGPMQKHELRSDAALPDIWIRGAQEFKGFQRKAMAHHDQGEDHEEHGDDEFYYIPKAEAVLSAGGGAFVLSESNGERYSFRRDWIVKITTSPKNLVLMDVAGESMYPTIHDGDSVMIDTSRQQIHDGRIYAIRMDDTISIKRLGLVPGDKIRIVADNRDEYPPYETKPADLHIIGQVIWYARTLVRPE